MAHGPGKYDGEATLMRARACAVGVILLVFGGSAGSGFSVQAPMELELSLPDIPEKIARDIRADLARPADPPGGAT